MDYKTKPTSREELRGIARFIRKLFKCKNKCRFDVMDAFERIPSVIPAVLVWSLRMMKLRAISRTMCSRL